VEAPDLDPVDESPPSPKPPLRKQPPPQRSTQNAERSESANALAQDDDKTVWEWLREVGTGATLKIKLERKYPKEWVSPDGQRHLVGGFIDEFDEPFTEQEVRARCGGGKYYVKTWRQSPNPKGGWVYAGAKTFEIEGNPKVVSSDARQIGGTPNTGRRFDEDDTSLQERALNTMEKLTMDAHKRARELEDKAHDPKPGIDADLLKLLTDHPAVRGMEARVADLNRALADKDARLFDLMTRRGEPTAQDRIFEKMVDGESSRIEAIRVQHDSELRQLRQSNADDMKSAREHMHGDLQLRERSHERELATLRETHMMQVKSIEQAYEARLDGFKGRMHDLERALAEAKVEVAELRAKKDKGPVESMEELASMKNAMEALGFGHNNNEDEPKWWQVAAGMVEPLVKATATRVENAPPLEQPPPQRRVMRRPGAPVPAGQPAQPGQVPMAMRKPKPAAPPTPPGPPVIEVSPIDLAAAIAFMESSIRNETPPAQFAESARSMVPKAILALIREKGADALYTVAKIEDGSPLYSQAGRNWLRSVCRVLVGEE
jgi:hypothetical protein